MTGKGNVTRRRRGARRGRFGTEKDAASESAIGLALVFETGPAACGELFDTRFVGHQSFRLV
jgi:hypothetical protein